ncbi:MAG: sulfurtransferase complex subunit TusC [SAR86 cluster bacterium]|uniref:Sulfurtransferase complex subunit TusC n=1 Tax=SAR86 cluster bacterium TaxID=2030880 RepID=A0A2A4X0M7_9GAMM|nr:MAG: sulfurtransferase complex subunit TusC [SAR86 cluster bacterium]
MTENANTAKPAKSRITFISRSAPYGNNRANLCLDMALASAVFEQDVNYVFLDDGVYQLLKGQDAAAIQSKTLGNALETLALYGIENVYADQQSLKKRGINRAELLPGMQLIDSDAVAKLIESADTVFNL